MEWYSYSLESSEEREEQFYDCLREMVNARSETLRDDVYKIFDSKKEEIEQSFEKAVKEGVQQVLYLKENGKKGSIRYVHFSYLLSNALSGETLIKIDFYDENYFSDIMDIDCYWDYSCLFPQYAHELEDMKKILQSHVMRLTSYEFQKAKTCYQVRNLMVLEKMIQRFVRSDGFRHIIQSCSGSSISVLYGAYLDQAELIDVWDREGE